MMQFAHAHPWMTFFIVLAGLDALAKILGGRR